MKPWYSLDGKSIWIIGGAGYLGSPIVEALDGLCQKTLCIDRGVRAEALVRERNLSNTVPLALDATEVDQLDSFVDEAIGEHGVPDGIVYMAYAASVGKRLEALTKVDFRETLDHSLTPAFLFCRRSAERMMPRGSGSIVLFSSMYGVVAPDPRIYKEPLTPNPIDYGAAKAAILQMTRYFAVHYGPSGIRFNCVTPGPFPNPSVQRDEPAFVGELGRKTAVCRIGHSREIVGPTLFLLTESASFVTGHSLVVDGGWMAW